MQVVPQSDFALPGLDNDRAFGSGHLLEFLGHFLGGLPGQLPGSFSMSFFSPGFVPSFFGPVPDLRSHC